MKATVLVFSAGLFMTLGGGIVYGQTTSGAPDVVGNIYTGITAVTSLAIAIGGAIGVVIALVQAFQGNKDHAGNVSRIAQIENTVQAWDQKFLDAVKTFQDQLIAHKDDINLLIQFGLEYNPVLSKYLADNNLTVESLISKIQKGQIDVAQLKQTLANLTPAPVTTATPPPATSS